MTIATGVAKQLRYKAESAWGVAPGVGSAQLLRRVTSSLALRKESYESAELRSDYQRADMRHGVRSVGGAINGELSPGTWKDFLAAAVRRAFAAVSSLTGLSLTVAGSGPTYTITRGSGSWLTDGVKAGMVGRLTAGAFNAANLNKNLLILSLTATVLTVKPLNGVALFAEGPIASATLAFPGGKTFAPTSGHTDPSFAFEHWHSDVSVSELFLGCKLNQLDIALPPTGISTIDLDFMGKDMTSSGAQYFTSPTAETTTGVMAAVNGVLAVQGSPIAVLTGMNFSVRGGMQAEPVVGSNVYADIAEGRIAIDGQLTALFDGATLADYFDDETEVSLMAAFTTSNLAAADFIAFTLPRIKLSGADKDDGEKNLIQTLPFTALFNTAGGAGTSSESTTLMIQDSQA